jgi:group I intron endonuclease
VTNQVNGKIYIGKTTRTLAQRKAAHLCDARKNKNYTFYRALRKYGFDNFSWEIIDSCSLIDDLIASEIRHIAEYKSHGPLGYNETDGGEGVLGMVFSTKTKIKRSAAVSGDKNPMFGSHRVGKENPFYGRRHSQQSIEKMRAARIGKSPSADTRKKLSAAKMGAKNHLFGKHHTVAAIEKMRDSKAGKYLGEKNPFYGKHHSEETIAKLRQKAIERSTRGKNGV